MFSEFALGTKAGGIDLAKAVPLPVDENQQGPGDLVRLEYGTGPCCARRAAALCADGAPALLPFGISVFKYRASGAGTRPACFVPAAGAHIEFLSGKTKGTEKRYVYLVSVPTSS
jgi:hypothetical protein